MLSKKMILGLFMAGSLSIALPSCKAKHSDADIKAKVEAALASDPGISVNVKEGIVTLSGTVSSPDVKSSAESTVNGLTKEGVKSVVDNLEVLAPPPPAANTTASPLESGVKDAIKDFPGVTASVNGGIITVTGTVQQSKIKTLKMALDALHPTKVDLTGVTVK